MTYLILVGIAALMAIYAVTIYNRLVALRNRFKNAFAQIDVQLTRRYDLIPNLVETARAYMRHERETLEAVIAARNAAATAEKRVAGKPEDAEAMRGLLGAETALTGALGRFFALSEAYPELKADQNMRQLTEELTSTENRIAFARQAYNDAVMRYNTAREVFPAVLIAEPLGFRPAELFEVNAPEQREAVKVSF
jgi:LemA protein